MKSYKTVAFTLILSYFRITQETYLVSIPQVGITTSADKKHAKKKDVDVWKIQREFKTKFFTVVKIFHYLLLKIIIE